MKFGRKQVTRPDNIKGYYCIPRSIRDVNHHIAELCSRKTLQSIRTKVRSSLLSPGVLNEYGDIITIVSVVLKEVPLRELATHQI